MALPCSASPAKHGATGCCRSRSGASGSGPASFPSGRRPGRDSPNPSWRSSATPTPTAGRCSTPRSTSQVIRTADSFRTASRRESRGPAAASSSAATSSAKSRIRSSSSPITREATGTRSKRRRPKCCFGRRRPPGGDAGGDNGGGEIADAAFDEGGHTGLIFAPIGRSIVDGIVRFDGTEWKRDEVVIPTGSETHFRILAVDATGLGNAWALAEPADSLGKSVVLLERTSSGPEGPWVERPLAGTPFANRDDPGEGIADVAPIGGRLAAAHSDLGRRLDRPLGPDRRSQHRRHPLLRLRQRRGDRLLVRRRSLRTLLCTITLSPLSKLFTCRPASSITPLVSAPGICGTGLIGRVPDTTK